MNCQLKFNSLTPLELKKIFCGLDDLFSNFDHLKYDCLDLGLDKIHSTVINVNSNLNPTHHSNTSEIHSLRLVYKKKHPDHPLFTTYYCIGYLQYPHEKEDHFSTDNHPIIYAVTVHKGTTAQITYAFASGTYAEFCLTTPLVLFAENPAVAISYLNQRDGEFLEDIFDFARKNRKELRENAIEDASSIFTVMKENQTSLTQTINGLFDKYRSQSPTPRTELDWCISKELKFQLPAVSVGDKIKAFCHHVMQDKILSNIFYNMLAAKPETPSLREHNSMAMRMERFNYMVESSNFSACLTSCIDEMIKNGCPADHPITQYVEDANPATRRKMFNLIAKRMFKSEQTLSGFAVNNLASDQAFRQHVASLIERLKVSRTLSDVQNALMSTDPIQANNPTLQEKNTSMQSTKIIGSALYTPPVIEQQTLEQLKSKDTTNEHDSSIILSSVHHEDSLSDGSCLIDADQTENVILAEQEAEPAQTETDKHQTEPEQAPVASIYCQDNFNDLSVLHKQPLSLIETINGSKTIDELLIEDLNIFPYFMRVYNPNTNSYEVQAHVLSVAYKEFFTKDKKPDGMINFLGFGHEILFNGNEFVAHEQTNIYALHQRKSKFASCAIVNFIEFGYETPYVIFLNNKKTSPQINHNHASSKKLLELTVQNHQAFSESAKIIAQQLTNSFKNYLKTTNRKCNCSSVLHFMGLEQAEIDTMNLVSITPQYYSELHPAQKEPVVEQASPIATEIKKETPVTKSPTPSTQGKTIFIDPDPSENLAPIMVREATVNELPVVDFIHTNNGLPVDKTDYSNEPVTPVIEPVATDTITATADVKPAAESTVPAIEPELSSKTVSPAEIATSDALTDFSQHPFYTRLTMQNKANTNEVFQYWMLETDLDFVLSIGLSKNLLKLNIQGYPDVLAVTLDAKDVIDRKEHYFMLMQFTSKDVAKLVRKFIKIQRKQALFNLFKSV